MLDGKKCEFCGKIDTRHTDLCIRSEDNDVFERIAESWREDLLVAPMPREQGAHWTSLTMD